MWTLKHFIFKYLEFLNFSNIFKKFNSSIPNLSSFFPVEIFLSVFASIFGLSLIPILIFLFLFLAIFSISLISLSDSALIRKINYI